MFIPELEIPMEVKHKLRNVIHIDASGSAFAATLPFHSPSEP